jgi:hypothetical protein
MVDAKKQVFAQTRRHVMDIEDIMVMVIGLVIALIMFALPIVLAITLSPWALLVALLSWPIGIMDVKISMEKI